MTENRVKRTESDGLEFSIITPVYNEPRLGETLQSIFSQEDVPGLEVIVVDGNSTDGTVAVIEEFRDEIDVLIREPDDGVYDAMNKGIRNASGDVVGILNADDRYQDEYVLRDVRSAMAKSGADTCYGDLVYVDDDDDVTRYWRSDCFEPRRFYFGWMPPHPTFFVRKEIYERYDTFDLDFPIAADYELMLRYLLKHEVSTTYVDRVLVRMATGGQSNESVLNILKANWGVAQSWRKNDLIGGIPVGIVKPMRKISQHFKSPNQDF